MKNLVGKGKEKAACIWKTGRKRKRIVLGGAGFILLILSAAGMAACRSAEGRESQKYRQLAAEYTQEDVWKKEMSKEVLQEALETGYRHALEDENAGGGDGNREESSLSSYDWEALGSINEDILGWLCLPGSLIDFPVVGAPDNEFYLSHDFAKEESSAGCPFMDSFTEDTDFNRVIYGHNMGTGSDAMFSTLLQFEDGDYFVENPVFYFTEKSGAAAAYQVMAVVKYNVNDVGEWDFRTRNHENRDSYYEWLGELRERALYYRETKKLPEKLLTLSTCDRREYGKDGRFLIFASALN